MKNIFTLFLFLLLPFLSTQMQAQKDAGHFYDVATVQELAIEFSSPEWRFMLDSLRFNGDDYLEGNLKINGTLLTGVGVRIRESKAFSPEQKRNNLEVKLNFTDEEQHYQGYTQLNLSSALRDPSMVREVLAYEMAGKYMPAPKANYAKVLVNDEYYGLLINIENVGEKFLEEHFVQTDGPLYYAYPRLEEEEMKSCGNASYTSLRYFTKPMCFARDFRLEQGSNFAPLVELVETLNKTPERIDEILNVDRTLWMLALNNVIANLSSYNGQHSPNYFLYQDTDGRFTPVIWDMNLAFGSFKNTGVGSDINLEQLKTMEPLQHVDDKDKPLISKLLSDDKYKKLYLSHLRTLVFNEFYSGMYRERAKELQQLIRTPLINDRNRYYNSSDFERSLTTTIGEVTKIPGIFELMEDRARFLRKHELLRILPPTIEDIKEKHRQRYSAQRVTNFQIQATISKYTQRVLLYYRFDDNEGFTAVTMKDDGENFDEEAGDNIYGAIIDPPAGQESIQYYIMAENAGLINFLPERYMYESRSVSLGELNK